MIKPKELKLYTQHSHFLRLEVENRNFFVRFLARLIRAVYDFFYSVGLALVKGVKAGARAGYIIISGIAAGVLMVLTAAKNDLANTTKSAPKRLGRLISREFLTSLAVFFVIALAGWGIIGLFKYVEAGLELKSNVESSALSGARYLAQAAEDINSHNFSSAQEKLSLASNFFSQGQNQLAGQGSVLGRIIKALPQGQDAGRLLEAASLVSRAGQNLVDFQSAVSQLHMSSAGLVSNNQNNGEILAGLSQSLGSAETSLNRAADLLSAVNAASLPADYRGEFTALQGNLQLFKSGLSATGQIFSLAQNLIEGKKNILVLFENNNELRPTGGFMGTFGSLQTQDGQIQKINVSSIYDLDGQLKDVIQPPLPIIAVTPQWSLRDSNWFADFPESARKISEFYQRESGQSGPDIIIAMTPDLIIDWLKISGPIYMSKYGVTLTPDNFVEETQAVTTISDNMPTNSPKQMLADLVPVLMQKISAADKNGARDFLAALLQNLSSKQVAVYAQDPALENQIQNFNWGGSLSVTDSDYLLLLDSNLGATKTNLNMDQTTSLTTTIGDDGGVTDQLKITRTNNNPVGADDSNVSFFRVYVPQGSRLISSAGFNKRDLQYPGDLNYQIDPDVYNEEKNSVTENLTGTTIGQESGKTFFGNWIVLDPGQSTTTTLVYQLPFKINSLDHYSLLLQKQMGALNYPFHWSVSYAGRKVLWQNFGATQQATNNLNSDIIIDKDYLFGLVLGKGY